MEIIIDCVDNRIQVIPYQKRMQTKTGKALNEAPTNKKVEFTEEESKNMTYGPKAANAKVLDYSFVNPQLNSWIDQWNRIINN